MFLVGGRECDAEATLRVQIQQRNAQTTLDGGMGDLNAYGRLADPPCWFVTANFFMLKPAC